MWQRHGFMESVDGGTARSKDLAVLALIFAPWLCLMCPQHRDEGW